MRALYAAEGYTCMQGYTYMHIHACPPFFFAYTHVCIYVRAAEAHRCGAQAHTDVVPKHTLVWCPSTHRSLV